MGNAQELRCADINGKKVAILRRCTLAAKAAPCCLWFLFQAVDAVTLQCAFPELIQFHSKHPFYTNAMLFDSIHPEGLEILAWKEQS